MQPPVLHYFLLAEADACSSPGHVLYRIISVFLDTFMRFVFFAGHDFLCCAAFMRVNSLGTLPLTACVQSTGACILQSTCPHAEITNHHFFLMC